MLAYVALPLLWTHYEHQKGLAKLPMVTQDLAKAKQLVAEAGYPDGLALEIACKGDPAWELASVQVMVEMWKAAGINVKINLMPSARSSAIRVRSYFSSRFVVEKTTKYILATGNQVLRAGH